MLAALLATSAVCTALPLVIGGPAMVVWDDGEYIRQTLATADHVDRYGLRSWPGYIVRDQLVRPPLYVNTLAAAVLLIGPANAIVAAGVVGGLTMAAFGAVVFWIVRRCAGAHVALAATAAMLAMPAVMRWFATAHADPLLSVFLLLAVGYLCVADPVWPVRRIVALGVAIGLALWSKATAPLFVALPLVYWLARPQATPVRQRLVVVAGAIAVAAAVAAPWYIPQGDGAYYYARVSSGFELGPVGATAFDRAITWLAYIVPRGWGYSLLVVGGLGLLGALTSLRRHEPGRVRHTFYMPLLVLGAAPMLVLAATSRVPANTRHVLPGLVFVACAVVIFALVRIDRSRLRAVLWPVCIAVILLQYAATTFTAIPAVGAAVRQVLPPTLMVRLAPAAVEYQPVSLAIPRQVLEPARALARAGRPRTWYLSGNNGYLNVQRLRMLAALEGVPVRFEWGSYFTWTPAQRADLRARMRRSHCVVVLYEPTTTAGTAEADLNRHNAELRAFVEDPDNGFEPLRDLTITGPNYSLSFFLQRGAIFWKQAP
jgi:4-amino-4-deoxy-L-arabinose transferase-like glycosyltransferase